MADNNRWGDRDREWREDRSWNERGRERGARGRGQQGFYGAAGDRDRYTAQGTGGEDRWRQMHQDRRHEGPAGYNDSGPAQGGWEFGDPEQGGERGQGYERYGYGRGGSETRRFDEYGRDPGVGAGYGETYGAGRDYGRGGGYGASSQGNRYSSQGYGSQTGSYAGEGGYGISAQGGDYGGYSTGQGQSGVGGQNRYAYGAHTPYGYRGSNEYDQRGRGGQYADDGRGEHENRSWLERAGEKVSAFFGAEDEGRHRGRGPKGYRRSDDRIREDVSDRLTDDPWLDASNIEVEVRECEVVLKGAVESREDKRRAENLAETISGVRNVQNHLRVEDNRDQTSASSGMRTQEGQTAMGEQATNTTSARGSTSTNNRDQKSSGSGRLQAPDATPGLNT